MTTTRRAFGALAAGAALAALAPAATASASPRHRRLLAHDDFRAGLRRWAVELEQGGTYYSGYGANYNTTTRLRRYVGEPGVRPLVYDYTEPLLVANEPNRVRIVSDGSTVQWWNNGRLVFDHTDPEPYRSGHFAFRTTWSHFRISDFRVWRSQRQHS